MNNIQKNFKTKSKLRCMADGGLAGSMNANSVLERRMQEAGLGAPAAAPAPAAAAAPAPVAAPAAPIEHLAPEHTIVNNDRQAAMNNALYAQMQAAEAAKNFGKVNELKQTLQFNGFKFPAQQLPAAPSPTGLADGGMISHKGGSALRSFFGLADGGPAVDPNRILNSRDLSIFTPQERQTFNSMSSDALATAANNTSTGLQAVSGPPPSAPEPQFDEMAPPKVELANGGRVKGKGGPTDDLVGPVALSDGEYVLPADTVAHIGRENLDAIRMATHDFTGKNRTSGLRKMADGGVMLKEINDPAARRAFMQARAAMNAGNPYGAQSVLNEAIPRATPAPAAPAAPAPAAAAAESAVPAAGRAAGVLRGLGTAVAVPLAAAGGISGAVQSVRDIGSGERDRFNNTVGADGPFTTAMADTARTFGNVGNAITGGLAGKLGQGLSNMAGGAGPADAFSPAAAPSFGNVTSGSSPAASALRAPDRNQGSMPNLSGFPDSDPRLTGATSPSYLAAKPEQIMGSFNGKNYTKSELDRLAGGLQTVSSPAATQPAANPMMDEIRSALRAGNGGFSAPASNARDINTRYDKLAKQLSGMYGREGQGNLARRLIELEGARSNALDSDARNVSTLRGQDVSAATANHNNATQLLQTLAQQQGTASVAQLKALQDAQKMAAEGEEKGFERYNTAIGSMFVGTDGKPDKAEQEKFTSFIQSSDPKAAQKFAAMAPQDQSKLLQDFKTLYDMNKSRNNTATKGAFNSGAITGKADLPVDVRESTFNDVMNNHLPLSDYLYSNLPFTNPNVVVGESGQPVLMSDAATTNGHYDADKLDLIRRRTGKDKNGRSALRSN